MFFLIGFIWHVAASFAFLIAILASNWFSLSNVTGSTNGTIRRGVFYVCEDILTTSTSQTLQCTSILDAQPGDIPRTRADEKFSVACAALAIGCAGLSLIIIWLSGLYFNSRKKTKCTSCLLIFIFLLLFITFCASAAVWILLISETLVLGYTIKRSMFNWPMWLAVGSTGGFFLAWILYLISFCRTCCGKRQRDESLYYARNQY